MLKLYAKIEPLIGFYDEYKELYKIYLNIIKKYPSIESILDIGCGNGSMLELLKEYKTKGIDLSEDMLNISKAKGLNVECIDIGDIKEKFDCILAIGDVLNYMNQTELKKFLDSVKKALKPDGFFIFDVNSKDGFEYVADGILLREFEDRFLKIEGVFENNILTTDILYFEKVGEFYSREQERILQYHHKDIKKLVPLKFINHIKIAMFSEDFTDKDIFIYQNKK